MKTLTSFLFCIFIVTFYSSCEPESLEESITKDYYHSENKEIGETGDQENEVDTTKN